MCEKKKIIGETMKIVVVGGSGLIGSKVVNKLKKLGHDVVAASPSTGVDATTGKGLAEALKGADVVMDVANSPSFDDRAAMEFFEKSGKNLIAAEEAAGVKHHIALSVVGTDRLADSGYFKGKIIQEKLIKSSPIPFTIVQSTQFFEFLPGIAQASTDGQKIRLPNAFFQPIAAEDVAAILTDIALGAPQKNTIEIAGPETFRMPELVQKYLTAAKDTRSVVSDNNAGYFGIKISENALMPSKRARLGPINFEKWLKNK